MPKETTQLVSRMSSGSQALGGFGVALSPASTVEQRGEFRSTVALDTNIHAGY
jgi:hypothetical protein